MFFVELKRAKKKASKYQKRWIKRLRALGYRAGVVAGGAAVTRFIQDYISLHGGIGRRNGLKIRRSNSIPVRLRVKAP